MSYYHDIHLFIHDKSIQIADNQIINEERIWERLHHKNKKVASIADIKKSISELWNQLFEAKTILKN